MGLFDKALDEQNKTPELDEAKIVAHVKQKIEEVRASATRTAHEGIWMTNIAYLLGYDGVVYNSQNRQFQPTSRAGTFAGRNKIHVNKVMPTIQNRLARLCKNPPKYDVRPESNSTEDKDAARLSLDVLSCMWDKLTLDKKRLFLMMWVQQCGHAWVKVSWDETQGNPMMDPSTGEPSGYEGEVRADIVSPFEVFPDPLAKSDDDVYDSWLIQCKVRKLEYFRTHYPEKGHLVKAEDAWLLSAQYEQRINNLNSRGPSSGSADNAMKDSAIEMVKYEARSKEYPQGRMIVCANGILLEDKPLPIGIIPFAKFDDIIVGGKLYSEAMITHLRPIQDQYNETIRRRSEWTRKMLAGKYHVFKGSGLSQESLNDESGEVVQTTWMPNVPDGGKPTPIAIPTIPQYAYQEEERLTQMFNDISGISEVSRGTLPSASIPAIGMQLLTEQDDTRIGVMTEQHEHAWARVGQLILKYCEAFWQLPRKLKMGQGKALTVKEIAGSDLKGNTDVIVIRGSTLPGSKTLKRQEIINTYSQGLLGDPNDPEVRENVLSMLEFGETSEMWKHRALDMAQIKRGIEIMEQGMMPPIDEMDNHPLWIQEINDYRKSEKFEILPPELQSLFIAVREMHIQQLVTLSTPPQMMDPNAPMPGEVAPPAQDEAPAEATGLEPPMEAEGMDPAMAVQ